MLPGCGQWTQQERANEVNAAMIEFLRSPWTRALVGDTGGPPCSRFRGRRTTRRDFCLKALEEPLTSIGLNLCAYLMPSL